MPYEPRFYRDSVQTEGLVSFGVIAGETDLFISAISDLSTEADAAVRVCRADIEAFIALTPKFAESLEPYDVPETAPEIVKQMAAAGRAAGVGPMAAVAGAVAEFVGRALILKSPDIIVENGGDIFIAATAPRRLSIYSGSSPLSNKISVVIKPEMTPLGICTSSGTVGHSVSFGRADAAVVMSPDTALADAWATRIGNMVSGPADLDKALAAAQNASDLTGVLIIVGDKLAVWGNVEIQPVFDKLEE